jgi:hypothetical protein
MSFRTEGDVLASVHVDRGLSVGLAGRSAIIRPILSASQTEDIAQGRAPGATGCPGYEHIDRTDREGGSGRAGTRFDQPRLVRELDGERNATCPHCVAQTGTWQIDFRRSFHKKSTRRRISLRRSGRDVGRSDGRKSRNSSSGRISAQTSDKHGRQGRGY